MRSKNRPSLFDIDSEAEVLVYDSNFPGTPEFLRSFSVAPRVYDPEGIAYSSLSHHLFILSDEDEKIYEYSTNGVFVDEFDISHFLPSPLTPQD